MWYVTAKPCHVCVLCIGVHDPGGTKWSCRRYTSPAFGKVSISLTSREHLTLVVTSHSLPHDAGISHYSGPINIGLPTI